MATIIDTLIVKLGLDSSGFSSGKGKVDKGLKETSAEANKAGVSLKKAGKDGADGFNTAAVSVGKFLAVIGGTVAIKRFIEQTIESSAALDRLSKNLQENVSTISAWANAAEIAGGTAEGLTGTMDMLSKSQTELMLTGQSSLIPYFSALGVALADVNGKARPANDILLDLSDRFSRMDRTTANNMGRMMGIDPGTMNLLLKGRREVELMIARQKEYAALTKQQGEEATRLREAMVKGRQQFEAFGRELLSTITPALEKLLAIFSDLGQWMRDNRDFVEAFLSTIAVGLGLIAAATIPINMTAVAVLALATAIGVLWDDYQTWKKGGDSLIDWSKWEPGIKAAGAGIRWLRDLASDAFYRIFAAADAIASVLSGDMAAAKRALGEVVSGNGKTYGSTSPIPEAPNASPAPGNMSPQRYFESKGWSPAQAAGIVANLHSESAMNPAAVGDKGKAYGIAQWHPDRQAAFKAWSGKDIRQSTLEEQLAFVNYELTEGNEKPAGAALRGAVTAERAGQIVSRRYERPAKAEGEALKRGRLASSMLLGIPGASGAGVGAGAASTAMAAAGVGAGDRTVQTSIGEIKVYTAATDADGIAKDMGKSMDFLFASQANNGMF